MSPTLLCKIMGPVFIVIALWGFVAGDRVLIFHVNPLHNAVHLLTGLAALICGFASASASKWFCLVFGSVYGLVALLGFLGVAPIVELLHLNTADNWLHLALGALFLAFGFAAVTTHSPRPRMAT